MKHLILCLLLVFLCATAGYAQITMTVKDNTTATPTTEVLSFSPEQTPVAAILEAIAGVGSIEASGTLVTVGSPSTTNQTDVLSVTDVAQDVPSLVDRNFVGIINHSGTETLWVSMDSEVASAAVGVGIPVFPYGFWGDALDSSKIIGVVTSTAANATVYQTGY
jgi:hypothetical protein